MKRNDCFLVLAKLILGGRSEGCQNINQNPIKSINFKSIPRYLYRHYFLQLILINGIRYYWLNLSGGSVFSTDNDNTRGLHCFALGYDNCVDCTRQMSEKFKAL